MRAQMPFDLHSRIVSRIYDCAEGNDNWDDVLISMADLFQLENAALTVIDSKLAHANVLSPRSNPDIARSYENFWWQHDPTSAVASAMSAGQYVTLDDTGREVFFGSAFYNDFWRLSGLGSERLSINLTSGNGLLSCLVLQPSARNDTIADTTVQSALMFSGHMARAIKWASRLARAEAERLLDRRRFAPGYAGFFILGAQGQILHADDAGELLLSKGDPFRALSGHLTDNDAQGATALRAALASINGLAELDATTVSLASGVSGPKGATLSLELLPFGDKAYGRFGIKPKVMVVASWVEEKSPDGQALLRDQFGLTFAEATLVLELLKGDGRAAAAQRCGISVNTARTHMMHIFQKIGINRQTELISLVMKTLPDRSAAK